MKKKTHETLRITLPGSVAPRTVFIKKHQPTAGDGLRQDSALFVAGIPFKLREGIQQLFSQFGTVEKVCWQPLSFLHLRTDVTFASQLDHCRYNFTPSKLQL